MQIMISGTNSIISMNATKLPEIKLMMEDHLRRIYAWCRVSMPQPQQERK